REANLVIYFGGTQAGGPLGGAKLQATLRRTVHKLQLVQSGTQLDEALKSGRVDVVLVDFPDLSGIARQLQAATSKPVILPILIKPSKADITAAQKEYKFVLKATADDFEYLAAINDAMKRRLKAGAKS